jgi:DNA-binding MarR family transcriptional regulator
VDDEIDAISAQWERERPGLDLEAMALFGRFGRLYLLANRSVEAVFARHGLQRGEFDVLAALRRSGAPYVLTPSTLSATLMLSRAGMTNRLDRLESAGLVQRELDPDDRRSFLVALTGRGTEVVEAAVDEHVANEARLLAALSAKDRANLDRMLRILLRDLSAG